MDASDLDQRATIEQRSVARGATFGEEDVTWTTLATVWAQIIDQVNVKKGGDEEVKDNVRVQARRTRIVMRYRNDLRADMRVQWPARGRTFQITGISEIGRREAIELTCEEYST